MAAIFKALPVTLCLLVTLLFSSCQNSVVPPTATTAPLATETPIPLPPATQTPVPTPTATPSPTPKATPTPTATPTPAPTAKPTQLSGLPAGWTVQQTALFTLALPSDWIAIDTSPEVVDQMVARAKVSHPELAGALDSLKGSEFLKFMAIDPSGTLGSYPTSASVSSELKLIADQSKYAGMLQQQFSGLGYVMTIGKAAKLNGLDTLRLTNDMSVAFGSSSIKVQQQILMVDSGSLRYLVALSYLAGSKDYSSLFEQVVNSFHLNPVAPTPTPPPTLAGTPNAQQLQALKDSVLKVTQQVEKARGLATKTAVNYQFIASKDLPAKLFDSLTKATTRARAQVDQELYILLDLWPADKDLYETLVDVYSEQVSGFYREDTGEMFVVSDTSTMDSLAGVILAHEYTHALQDQNFGLASLQLDQTDNSDRAMAARSLVEGDATLLQGMYMVGLGQTVMSEIIDKLSQMDQEKYKAAPSVIQEDLTFPYEFGAQFVQALGGWQAIDDAYKNPPQSTEQIMDPAKYKSGELPVPVSLPDLSATLETDWTLREANTMGQYGLRQYLKVYVDAAQAASAAAGWGGDRFAYYKDSAGKKLFVSKSAWDTPEDAREFFSAYVAFAAKKSGGAWKTTLNEADTKTWTSVESNIHLSIRNSDVLLVIASDATALNAVMGKFGGY